MSDWPGLPDPDDAAGRVIERYLGAYGPATPEVFDQWLLRGATSRKTLRRWFAELGDRITLVDVGGRPGYLRTADLDELADTEPHPVVRLLPGFDQYVLGPGTADPELIPSGYRAEVSRAAGWIAPVIVSNGRVCGTWRAEAGRPAPEFFEPAGQPGSGAERKRLDAELDRVAALLD